MDKFILFLKESSVSKVIMFFRVCFSWFFVFFCENGNTKTSALSPSISLPHKDTAYCHVLSWLSQLKNEGKDGGKEWWCRPGCHIFRKVNFLIWETWVLKLTSALNQPLRVSVPMDCVGFLGANCQIQAVMFTEPYFWWKKGTPCSQAEKVLRGKKGRCQGHVSSLACTYGPRRPQKDRKSY